MRIVIEIDAADPPAGRLSVTPKRPRQRRILAFNGWLGLLHVLSEAMDVAPLASPEIPHAGDGKRLIPTHDH